MLISQKCRQLHSSTATFGTFNRRKGSLDVPSSTYDFCVNLSDPLVSSDIMGLFPPVVHCFLNLHSMKTVFLHLFILCLFNCLETPYFVRSTNVYETLFLFFLLRSNCLLFICSSFTLTSPFLTSGAKRLQEGHYRAPLPFSL